MDDNRSFQDSLSSSSAALESAQAMNAWIRSMCLSGMAHIERHAERHCARISADGAARTFAIGVLRGRAYIAARRDVMRWLSRISWRRAILHPTRTGGTSALEFEFSSGSRGGFGLLLDLPPGLDVLLFEHAVIDCRYSSDDLLSVAILTTVPLEIGRAHEANGNRLNQARNHYARHIGGR